MKEGMAWASHTAVTVVELASAGFDGMSPFLLLTPVNAMTLGLTGRSALYILKCMRAAGSHTPCLTGLHP